ncbi:MAG: nicotinamide mononucleotide transporter [Halieaceae bacterium]|nr:nicotinamide mononucleotide transporter [Halieaceae bacterium]
MSPLETTAVGLALAYIALAMRQSRLCWVAAIISAAIYIAIFTEVKLYMEAGLQLVYIAMAMVGWIFWGKDDSDEALAVTTRPMQFHLIAISGISIAAACTGFLLSHYTDAVRPYVDSMTTVAAIVCTWMVTRKILENWLYWIVINCVSVWLFMDRGLDLTSGLFVLYALLSVIGYFTWRRSLLQ